MLFSRIAICIFLLTASYSSLAENQVSERFLVLDIASGTFVQKRYFKILSKPIVSEGQVFFDRNVGLIWQTISPVASTLTLKSDGLFTKSKISDKKQINSAKPLVDILMQAMSGNLEQLTQAFNITNLRSKECLKLTPIDNTFKAISSHIELCGKQVIDSIVLTEISGNKTEITMQLQKVDALPEAISAQLQ